MNKTPKSLLRGLIAGSKEDGKSLTENDNFESKETKDLMKGFISNKNSFAAPIKLSDRTDLQFKTPDKKIIIEDSNNKSIIIQNDNIDSDKMNFLIKVDRNKQKQKSEKWNNLLEIYLTSVNLFLLFGISITFIIIALILFVSIRNSKSSNLMCYDKVYQIFIEIIDLIVQLKQFTLTVLL